jgi:hypothetical protein
MKSNHKGFLRKSVSAFAIVIMAAGLSGCLGSSSGNPLIDDGGPQVTPTGGGNTGGSGGSRTSVSTGFGVKAAGKMSTNSEGDPTYLSQDTTTHGPANLMATVTEDANGDVSRITVSYDDGAQTGVYTSADKVEGRTGEYRKNGTRLKYKTYDGYNYLAVGRWEKKVPNNASNSEFWIVKGVVGELTDNMPTKGQARYTGGGSIEAVVTGDHGKITDDLSAEFKAGFTADFNNGTVTGGFSDFHNDDGNPISGGINLSNGKITDNSFKGNLTGDIKGHQLDASRSKLKGGFFGPNAEEMGGVMTVKVPKGIGTGSFIAKQ